MTSTVLLRFFSGFFLGEGGNSRYFFWYYRFNNVLGKSEAEFIVIGEWPKIKRTESIFKDRSYSQGSRNHHVFGSYIAIPKPKLQSKLEASLTKPPCEGFSGVQFLRVPNCLRSLSTKCAVNLSTIFYSCKRTKFRDVSCFIISYQPVFKSLKWWHNFGRASYSPTWKELDVICLEWHFVCLIAR